MTNSQIKAIRAAINAAHNSGNTVEADKLQTQLHNHFSQDSAAFVKSAEGRKHMDALASKFD